MSKLTEQTLSRKLVVTVAEGKKVWQISHWLLKHLLRSDMSLHLHFVGQSKSRGHASLERDREMDMTCNSHAEQAEACGLRQILLHEWALRPQSQFRPGGQVGAGILFFSFYLYLFFFFKVREDVYEWEAFLEKMKVFLENLGLLKIYPREHLVCKKYIQPS